MAKNQPITEAVLNIAGWVAIILVYAGIVSLGVLMVTIWSEKQFVSGVILLTLFIAPLVLVIVSELLGLCCSPFAAASMKIKPTEKQGGGSQTENELEKLMRVVSIQPGYP